MTNNIAKPIKDIQFWHQAKLPNIYSKTPYKQSPLCRHIPVDSLQEGGLRGKWAAELSCRFLCFSSFVGFMGASFIIIILIHTEKVGT